MLGLASVTNNAVNEKPSGSTDMGLYVSKAWYSFSRLSGLICSCSLKKSFLFSQFLIGSLSMPEWFRGCQSH